MLTFKWGLSKMWRVFIVAIPLLVTISGCKFNNLEEVVNEHNEIQNLEGLNRFVENVKKQKADEINYVQYGIEGQRGVRTLTVNGEEINVSFSVDREFIEEFNCKDIAVETDERDKKYLLSQCTGTMNEDFELLSVPK
jgi:hypothetical protein